MRSELGAQLRDQRLVAFFGEVEPENIAWECAACCADPDRANEAFLTPLQKRPERTTCMNYPVPRFSDPRLLVSLKRDIVSRGFSIQSKWRRDGSVEVEVFSDQGFWWGESDQQDEHDEGTVGLENLALLRAAARWSLTKTD